MVRRTRGSPSTGSSNPASSAHARCGASGPSSASASERPRVEPKAQDRRLRGGRAHRSSSSPGGNDGSPRRPARARQGTRRAARRSSGGGAVECVRAGTHRLVRPARPVGEVVPALVAGSRPVGDLVAAEPGRGEALHRQPVLRGGPIVVLPARPPRPPARAPGVVGRWSPVGPVRPSASGSSRVRAYGESVVRLERQRGVQRGRPDRLASAPGTSYRRSSEID